MKVCEACGLEFKGHGVRYCSKKCYGVTRRGANNPRFNGGISEWQGRTIVVCRDGGWLLYSRALMAAQLGRELRADEIVHHINGDRADDRVENLQVVSRAEHMELHREELLAARGIAKAAA